MIKETNVKTVTVNFEWKFFFECNFFFDNNNDDKSNNKCYINKRYTVQ